MYRDHKISDPTAMIHADFSAFLIIVRSIKKSMASFLFFHQLPQNIEKDQDPGCGKDGKQEDGGFGERAEIRFLGSACFMLA